MFIDEVTITVKSGKGGDGCVSFDPTMGRHGLPDGGNGGRGGDIFLKGTTNLAALAKFRHQKYFRAVNGQNGMSKQKYGKDGEDLVLVAPVGTVAHNTMLGIDTEVLHEGEMVRVAKGGGGGRGNLEFKSSVNRSPQKAEHGLPGEEFKITLELRLIADVGFVGLPNVGKSSMLNELTDAEAKVANYPFTTLEPNLGALDGIILADIPGLIEGASQGKGLGVKFLRHIQRTRHLVHFISAESSSPVSDYRTVRRELKKHSPELLKKKEYIFLSKSDAVSAKELKSKIAGLKKIHPRVRAVSIHDWDAVQKARKLIVHMAKK